MGETFEIDEEKDKAAVPQYSANVFVVFCVVNSAGTSMAAAGFDLRQGREDEPVAEPP